MLALLVPGARASASVNVRWTRIGGVAYVLAAAIGVLSVPNASPPGIGLGPSWTIGLAHAERAHLLFGRDIVFSYGPLGFLVTPYADVGNFIAMTAFQLSFLIVILCVVVACMRATSSRYQRILLAVGVPLMLANAAFETWPPFLVLLLLARRAKRNEPQPLTMFGAGLVGGLFALTKFTVAIDVCLVSATYFFVELVIGRRARRSVANSFGDGLALLSGLIAASAWKFLSTDDGAVVSVVITMTAVAGLLGAARAATTEGFRPLGRAGLGLVATLVIVAAATSPSYRSYVETSLLIATGYSAAHALDGPLWQTQAALIWLAGFAIVAFTSRTFENGAVMIALLVYEWTVFKLGFVRHDLHVISFYVSSAFAAIVLVYSSPTRRTMVSTSVVMAAAVIALANELSYANLGTVLGTLSFEKTAYNVDVLMHMQSHEVAVDSDDIRNDAVDVLPSAMLSAIGTRPVDAVPIETDFAFANHLNWDPEPVFQTIMAYSPPLDAIDLRSLESRRNDAILYGFASIDGRYPGGDEPRTFAYSLCNYEPYAGPWEPSLPLLLLRRDGSRCRARGTSQPQQIAWNVPITIPHRPGYLTFARIRLLPNLAGRARVFAFRSPLVYVTVGHNDGSANRYRLVWANSDEGILVDPAPRDATELKKLFSDTLGETATTLSIEGDPRWFEAPVLSFSSVAFSPWPPRT